MKGCFSAFRNPTAHEPRIVWHVSEADTLDLLSTLSLIHRRLDNAVVLRRRMTPGPEPVPVARYHPGLGQLGTGSASSGGGLNWNCR